MDVSAQRTGTGHDMGTGAGHDMGQGRSGTGDIGCGRTRSQGRDMTWAMERDDRDIGSGTGQDMGQGRGRNRTDIILMCGSMKTCFSKQFPSQF
jgi:hypothetical protein